MTLRETLEGKKERIVSKWLDVALSLYARDASAAFARQKDQFANPVGHSLREGTLAIFDALLEGNDTEKIRRHLVEIIRIRAVQQFAASEALDFIFRLKELVRNEVPEVLSSGMSNEFVEFERKVDEVALMAFDVYVESREKVFELRSNELRRNVSWIIDKLNERENGPEKTGTERDNESPRA